MTKRYLMMAALLAATTVAKSQDTYLNDRLTATDDVNGSARYVGMGGAMGALGADLSVIGSNPAGMALYRKNDIRLTFGAVVPNNAGGWSRNDLRAYDDKLAKASFDQMGIVWSLNTGTDKLKYVNFGFNYQKKANYNMGFYADGSLAMGDYTGLSQMDQVTELAQNGYNTDYNLAGRALGYGFLETDADGNAINNTYGGESYQYTRHQWGSLQAFDINFAFNVKDRFYTGMTVGIDNVDYQSWSEYYERNSNVDGSFGDYSLYNDRDISGVGVNVKLGFLVRPIEENPFRVGLAVETPTWYRMKSSTLFDLTDIENYRTPQSPDSYLEYTVRTPWRVRLSAGSTVDKVLAWGVEYEYANTSKTSMGYPKWDDNDYYHSSFVSTKDPFMNRQTKDVLRGQHTVKVGMEVKPVDALALRVGYNFVSSRYKDNPTFDQCSLAEGDNERYYSYAMDYQTSTDFMTLGSTNIVTFGVGYTYKKFYVDLAYKYRVQNAKFYAFDTSYTNPEWQFAQENPALAGATIQPVDVDLHRHQLMMSLGFKF